jgi:non-specific serine/threonine protein kinase
VHVIHGLWARGTLCLWAEDPSRPAASPGRSPEPAPHPFACQAGELADLLAALPGSAGEAARKSVDDELTLQLPSAASPARPLASPELVRPAAPHAPDASAAPHAADAPDALAAPHAPEPRAGRVRLARWRVPVLAFAPAAALDLLGATAGLGELVDRGEG